MRLLSLLRAALALAPAEVSAEELEARWQRLYDTKPGSPEEEAAYREMQKALVAEGQAA